MSNTKPTVRLNPETGELEPLVGWVLDNGRTRFHYDENGFLSDPPEGVPAVIYSNGFIESWNHGTLRWRSCDTFKPSVEEAYFIE